MIALFWLGLLVGCIGGIWLLVVAFKESVWWGLGSLFIAPVGLVFVILHWQVAKKPFLIELAGVALCVIAMLAMPELRSSMSV